LGDQFCFAFPLQLPLGVDAVAKILVRLESLQVASHLAGFCLSGCFS
jgi:hypothetical protein